MGRRKKKRCVRRVHNLKEIYDTLVSLNIGYLVLPEKNFGYTRYHFKIRDTYLFVYQVVDEEPYDELFMKIDSICAYKKNSNSSMVFNQDKFNVILQKFDEYIDQIELIAKNYDDLEGYQIEIGSKVEVKREGFEEFSILTKNYERVLLAYKEDDKYTIRVFGKITKNEVKKAITAVMMV